MRYYNFTRRGHATCACPPVSPKSTAAWRRFAWAALVGALSLVGSSLVARSAGAQTYTTPRIRIAPTGGNYAAGGQVIASVQYCSRYPFQPGSEHLDLNGTAISFTGTTTVNG